MRLFLILKSNKRMWKKPDGDPKLLKINVTFKKSVFQVKNKSREKPGKMPLIVSVSIEPLLALYMKAIALVLSFKVVLGTSN